MGDTSGAGTHYPSEAPRVLPRFLVGVRAARSLLFCLEFCRSLFVLLSFFLLVAIVLSLLLPYRDSVYPIGIFKLVFICHYGNRALYMLLWDFLICCWNHQTIFISIQQDINIGEIIKSFYFIYFLKHIWLSK